MICPECKAEYRDGFTVCSDCEIPLVGEIPLSAPNPTIESSAGPLTEPRMIWKGEDQSRCLELCLQLRAAGIPYTVAQKMKSSDGISVAWSYELYVSAADERRAQQLLDVPELDAGENPGPADDGFRADATDGDDEDPFCAFWEGDDARICAEICGVLDEASIPHRVLRREANLFRISARSQMKVGVPFSLYQKAEQIIVEAFGVAEETKTLPWHAEEDGTKPID
jgi:hypothetical protein